MIFTLKLNGHVSVSGESLTEAISKLPDALKPRAVMLFSDSLHLTQNRLYYLHFQPNPQEWMTVKSKLCLKKEEGDKWLATLLH